MSTALSIVVASLDALPLLTRLHGDVMACDPAVVELIIADGCSQDGTRAWLESVMAQPAGPRVSWLSTRDTGIAQAWNRALDMVKGRWVLFLGADDRVSAPTAIRHVLELADQISPTPEFVSLPVTIVSPRGQRIAENRPEPGPSNRRLLALNTVPHQGLLHRADIWTRFGGFDETFRIAADYEFLVRALRRGGAIAVLDHPPITQMTFGGTSKHDPLATVMEIRRAQQKAGIRLPAPAWWRAWLRAFARAAVLPVLGTANTGRLADLVRRIRGLEPIWTVP